MAALSDEAPKEHLSRVAACGVPGCSSPVGEGRRWLCATHAAMPKHERRKLRGQSNASTLRGYRIDHREMGNELAARPPIDNPDYVDEQSGPCEIHEGETHPCPHCISAISAILADVRDDIREREQRSAGVPPKGQLWRAGYLRGPK